LANNILEKQDVAGLTLNDLKRGDNREIFKSLQLWTASQTPKYEVLAEIAGKELEPYLTNLLAQWHNKPVVPDENVDQDLSIAILRLRMQNINEQINELTFLQREAQDLATIRHYMEMVEQYKQQRKQLEQIRDALSLTGKRRLEANHFGEVI
jgi:hypothetical protein